jgi:hypothetical protein
MMLGAAAGGLDVPQIAAWLTARVGAARHSAAKRAEAVSGSGGLGL